MTNQLPLFIPPPIHNSEAGGSEIPWVLERPDPKSHIARLTFIYSTPDENGENDPRWKIEGSPVAVNLARKVFGVLYASQRSVTFPAWESAFEDLLMVMHRYPIEVAPSARAEFDRQHEILLETYLAGVSNETGVATSRGGRFKGTLRDFQEQGVGFMLKDTARAALQTEKEEQS